MSIAPSAKATRSSPIAGGETVPVGVILAAGVGSRLRPLTNDRPKALVEVGGETILARAVRLLAAAGIRELVVATGYRPDALERALASAPIPVIFCHNERYAETQNAVSLALCEAATAGRAFYKLDGDVLFRAEVLLRLAAAPGAIAVAVEHRDDLGDEEMKVLVSGDRILSFGKRLDPAKSFGESIGIERVSASAAPVLFAALRQASDSGEHHLYYEDIYARLIDSGLDVRMAEVSDLPWTEVDTPEDLARARQLVASGRLAG